MPQSSIVRRLGPKWFDLIDRIRELDLPADGMPLGVFGLRLTGVPPNHVGEVAHALARKGAIWIGKSRNGPMVYRRKPEGIPTRSQPDAIADTMARIIPHACAIAEALREEAEASSTVAKITAWAKIDEAAKRVLKELARAIASGATLGALRSRLHAVYHPSIVDAMTRADPALREKSEERELSEAKAYPRLEAPSTMKLSDRIAMEIERRGSDGAGRSDLLTSISPRIGAAELTAALDELEGDGIVDSVVMLAPGAFRKAARYFRPDFLPDLDQHGRPLKAF